jgi:phosphomannomutase
LEAMEPKVSDETKLELRTSCVIGYDHRHNSKLFALYAAIPFVLKGYRVYFFSEIVPTPFVVIRRLTKAFATRFLKASCGIMITASHNPKKDNGLKLYWKTGCQIKSPMDEEISRIISQNLAPWPNSTVKNDFSNIFIDPFKQVGKFKQRFVMHIFRKCLN